jgi:non-ribosomal peptide synthetase component F
MEGQPPDLFRLFESRALSEQQAPAVVHYSRCRGSAVQGEVTLKSTSIDYEDLLIRASGLARTLEAAQGSPRKRFLVLYARPSIPMVVGVLGCAPHPLFPHCLYSSSRGLRQSSTALPWHTLSVLQSGNAYVPLDPTHPAPRKAKALRRLACCLGCVVVEAHACVMHPKCCSFIHRRGLPLQVSPR